MLVADGVTIFKIHLTYLMCRTSQHSCCEPLSIDKGSCHPKKDQTASSLLLLLCAPQPALAVQFWSHQISWLVHIKIEEGSRMRFSSLHCSKAKIEQFALSPWLMILVRWWVIVYCTTFGGMVKMLAYLRSDSLFSCILNSAIILLFASKMWKSQCSKMRNHGICQRMSLMKRPTTNRTTDIECIYNNSHRSQWHPQIVSFLFNPDFPFWRPHSHM